MFDTGEPTTGPELARALTTLVAEGRSLLASFTDMAFFASQGAAGSPADHVRHLRKCAVPVVIALGVPRWILRWRFGRRRGGSRTFVEVRDAYLATLAAGGGGEEGRYAPTPEPTPSDPGSRRGDILQRWSGTCDALAHRVSRWEEAQLDRFQLPEPLMGLLTVREMLAFTVYHTAHHLRRVAERAAGAAPWLSPTP